MFEDCETRLLLVLVSVLSEFLLPLMSSNLMLLSFSSTRHDRAPYPLRYPIGICNYRAIMRCYTNNVKRHTYKKWRVHVSQYPLGKHHRLLLFDIARCFVKRIGRNIPVG